MNYGQVIKESRNFSARQKLMSEGVRLVEGCSMSEVFLGDPERVTEHLVSMVSALSELKASGKKVEAPLRYARSLLTRVRAQDADARKSCLEGLNHLLRKAFKKEDVVEIPTVVAVDLEKYRALVGRSFKVDDHIVVVKDSEMEINGSQGGWSYPLTAAGFGIPASSEAWEVLNIVMQALDLVPIAIDPELEPIASEPIVSEPTEARKWAESAVFSRAEWLVNYKKWGALPPEKELIIPLKGGRVLAQAKRWRIMDYFNDKDPVNGITDWFSIEYIRGRDWIVIAKFRNKDAAMKAFQRIDPEDNPENNGFQDPKMKWA